MFSGDLRQMKERAHALAVKGKWPQVVDEHRRIVKVAPNDLANRQKLADALARVGRPAEAIHEYQQVVGAYAVDGFLLKAMALCKVILAIDPAHTQTQQTLALLYAQKKTAPGGITLPASMSAAAIAPAARSARPPLPSQGDAAPIEWSDILNTGELRVAASFVADSNAPPQETQEIQLEDSDVLVLDEFAVPAIPLFGELDTDAFVAILERMNLKHVEAGQVLVREGAAGSSMLIVVQGRVDVLRGAGEASLKIAEMGDGAVFGEMALLSEASRFATVTAKTDCILLELTRKVYDETAAAHPSVAAGVEHFYRERLLANLMRSSPLFQPLDGQAREALAQRFETVTMAKGQPVLTQGQKGDGLYMILRGECHAVTSGGASEQTHPVMREGDVFGEISLVYGTPVTATVTAAGPCVLLRLPEAAFNTLVRPNPQVAAAIKQIGEDRLGRTELQFSADVEPTTPAV